MKKSKRPEIPLHSNELQSQSGILLHRYEQLSGIPASKAGRLLEAHRDDHYIFVLQQRGHSKLMLDFAQVELKDSMVFFILPGQVHHYLDLKNYSGWFIAIETRLVGEQFTAVFEDQRFTRQTFAVNDNRLPVMALEMLQTYLETVPIECRNPAVLNVMIQSFTGLIAGYFREASADGKMGSGQRAIQLLTRFRKLVTRHYRSIKSPAEYAAKMNLSLSYLNEMIKRATGFPVSYWIREEIMLEARRLLCYTDLDVKEVAYRLGFTDHTYFSRLFRKAAGETPLDFRREYRVLSNHPA